MTTHWDRFLKDKKYSRNVSDATYTAYKCAWNAWHRFLPEDPAKITGDTILDVKIGLQQVGLAPISVNTYLRVLRTFVRWLNVKGADGHPLPVKYIIQPKILPPTYTQEQLEALLRAPTQCMTAERVRLLAMIYMDTGARAEEILKLKRTAIDLDRCRIKVDGKGSRERIVPFNPQLKAELYQWMRREPDAELLFPHCSYRNALRDFKALARSVGITGKKISFHTFRHTMGSRYIADGGDVFHLQQVLGHSSIKITENYVHLNVENLSKAHERLSLLGRVRRKRRFE